MAPVEKMMDEFCTTFRGPRPESLQSLSVTERETALNIIFEEFLELVNASGFRLGVEDGVDSIEGVEMRLIHREGSRQNPVEMADGLGDLVVTAFDMAHRMGINLGLVIEEIHSSNMSKLSLAGTPIINECERLDCDTEDSTGDTCMNPRHYTDPSKPLGKILKGRSYSPPNLLPILAISTHEEEA